jgi:hypothetical protein
LVKQKLLMEVAVQGLVPEVQAGHVVVHVVLNLAVINNAF